jgi:hypothetical protein
MTALSLTSLSTRELVRLKKTNQRAIPVLGQPEVTPKGMFLCPDVLVLGKVDEKNSLSLPSQNTRYGAGGFSTWFGFSVGNDAILVGCLDNLRFDWWVICSALSDEPLPWFDTTPLDGGDLVLFDIFDAIHKHWTGEPLPSSVYADHPALLAFLECRSMSTTLPQAPLAGPKPRL